MYHQIEVRFRQGCFNMHCVSMNKPELQMSSRQAMLHRNCLGEASCYEQDCSLHSFYW